MWAAAPPPDGGDAVVGIVYLFLFGCLGWLIFGKHDRGGDE